ncbi:MAG: 5-formyltetrahydrofolate cyclo-ligase [Oscillospiraceae bacterium]|nr:5-formyltetrahydrofolate cyclo-ligase [Oscillospiraceae bacterium]
MGFAEEKKALRTALRRKRREIPDDVRKPLDEAIFRNVIQSRWFLEADTLLLYVSSKGEADTIRIIEEAHRLGKQVAVPKCGENGRMDFFLIGSMADLAEGAYGILEPTGTQQPKITDKTVCIVPAVAYTSEGARLGQGGGYYDRFLEEYPKMRTVGICYSCMLLPELPCEVHDRRVDAVLTEKKL